MQPYTHLLSFSCLLLILTVSGFSQKTESPRADRLVFPSITPGATEPRIGVMRNFDGSGLRLDIGASVDLTTWAGDTAVEERISIGADAYVWTALRQEDDFHFPVDAVDYLFGINVNYGRDIADDLRAQGRLRFSHISAHLADGSFDRGSMQWRDGQLPRVYSREYFELILATDYRNSFRAFTGMTYLYHVDPDIFGPFAFHAGLEIRGPSILHDLVHPLAAYRLDVTEAGVVTADHSVIAAVDIGDRHGRAVRLYLSWLSGRSVHGEYFDRRERYGGLGIEIRH